MYRARFFYSIKVCLELVVLISMSTYIQSKPFGLNEASPFTYLLATPSFPIFSLIFLILFVHS
ncbi:hypothetical protein C8F04DRAFT_1151455, partial [Mycena alexandri]